MDAGPRLDWGAYGQEPTKDQVDLLTVHDDPKEL